MTDKSDAFQSWIQLEQPRLGSEVTFATDDFFADKSRLIQPTEPVFIDDKYDDHGKWMDGWESRRKRTPGYDYCIVKLGVPGIVHGVEIDTRFFTGNFPPEASIDACVSDDDVPAGEWTEILPKVELQGDSRLFFDVRHESVVSHLRLNIYPDGGIARLRVFGEIRPALSSADGLVDLVALENGGRALAASDQHYGSKHNLNVAGRGINMGDGWETARRRGPGNDWVILALGQPGVIESALIDTAHFKGNYPDRVSLEAARFDSHEAAVKDNDQWQTLLPESKLEMDREHTFESLADVGVVTHVRMAIFPDGGVSRLRLFGRVAEDAS